MAASLWGVGLAITAFKLFLIPAYRSTDFEVHRNWLAITHSLPVNEWYRDTTSQWTLDYPPLFAWFEYLLSHLAKYFDAKMLVVSNLYYASYFTVLFQRLSVIATDFVYIYASIRFSSKFTRPWTPNAIGGGGDNWEWMQAPGLILGCLLLSNIGLTIVDNIHFQYNGFLFGILLLSIIRMFDGRYKSAAFFFVVLLNLKHIFLYVAPAYFVYLLRCYVFTSKPDGRINLRSFSPLRLISLASIVFFVFFASFFPFAKKADMMQVLQRLFPFRRGLCHAYWAPNFWALYNVADKALLVAGGKFGLLGDVSRSNASMTGGLVQQVDHAVLPTVTPTTTLVITLLSILPSVWNLWLRPAGPHGFLLCLINCAFSSFMFGWHVHEKAVLMVTIPLTLLTLHNKKLAQVFLILTTIGHFSLFPLLFRNFEIPLRILLWLFYNLYSFPSLAFCYKDSGRWSSLPLLSRLESLYLFGLLPLETYNLIIHDRLRATKGYPFLPLLLTSAYCAAGMVYCWVRLGRFTLAPRQAKKPKR